MIFEAPLRSARPGMLRDMRWLTAWRARLYGSGMAITLALIFGWWMLLCFRRGGYDLNDDLIGADFSSFWAASLQALAGRAAEVYVPELHQLAERPYLRNGYEAFFYSPAYLVACLPLALASYFASLLIFISATGALFISVIWRTLRSPWCLAAILSFPPFYLNILAGQNAFLTAAILGWGLTTINHRPDLAGLILGLMVMKPHLALGIPVALIVTRRWRTLAWAAASSVCLVVLSYVLFGWETWLGFFNVSHSARETLENGAVSYWKMQSAFAVARILGADVATAYVLHGIVAICALCALVWALRRPISAASERSIVVLACLLITPFSLTYDMLLLALPLAWMWYQWQKFGFPPWSKLVLSLSFLAPMVLYLPIIYGFSLGPLPFGAPAVSLFLGALLIFEVTKSDHAAQTCIVAHAKSQKPQSALTS